MQTSFTFTHGSENNEQDSRYDLTSFAMMSGKVRKFFQNEQDLLHWCCSVIQDSPMAMRLFELAMNEKWSISFESLDEGDYYIDTEEHVIILDHLGLAPQVFNRSIYFRNSVLFALLKALRDVWHETVTQSYNGHLTPVEFLKTERFRTADITSVAIYAAWELRGAGYHDIWRHILGSDESDMASVLSSFLELNPSAQFDYSALFVVFEQFYAEDTRVKATDHEILDYMDEAVQADQDEHPFGAGFLTASLIREISMLPGGVSYLAGKENDVLQDPYYAGMSDPINQTYLLQIIDDMDVFVAGNISFRDRNLARMMFPDNDIMSVH